MILIDQLTSIYPGTVNGLKGFSCEFEPGVYALLGKNGSGKTTLFRNLVGAIFSQKGTCRILDKDPKKRNPNLLQEIFLIPEEPFFPDVTPKEYLNALSPFYPRFDKKILQKLMDLWEIPHSGLRRMSQGQKKKFLIAFALATQVQIMLFDEPTNGLDIVSKVNFKNLGNEMFQKHQTFIFATHQIQDVESLIDHVTLIDNGRSWGNYSLKMLKKKFITKKINKQDPQSLFSLPSQDGYLTLKKRKREEAHLDLEIFFTAFLDNPSHLQSLIKNG